MKSIKKYNQEGKLHCEDGPAWIQKNGTYNWFLNGKKHRGGDDPAVYNEKQREYWVNGKLHRETGPALDFADGHKEWWINGEIKKALFEDGTVEWYNNDLLHRENGPAVEYPDNTEKYWLEGNLYSNKKEWEKQIKKYQLIKKDLPICTDINGAKCWKLNGLWHRENGPAYEGRTGHKEWLIMGKLHRLDGPAIEFANGDKTWYKDGLLHRLDGPACEGVYENEWWVEGKRYSQADFEAKFGQPKQDIIMRRFEYKDTYSNKFWEITCPSGSSSYTVKFGPIGKTGQIQVKTFASALLAQEATRKKVAEKISKGYIEILPPKPKVEEKKLVKEPTYYDIRSFINLNRITGNGKKTLDGHTLMLKDGKRHNEEGPAVILSNGKQFYYLDNKKYSSKSAWERELNDRKGKPTFKNNSDGSQEWRLKGKFHRVDGPARISSKGDRYWYNDGQFHRTNGPAIEGTAGDKYWIIEGLYHREDGPAVEYSNGNKNWYLKGVQYSEREWRKLTNQEVKPKCQCNICLLSILASLI